MSVTDELETLPIETPSAHYPILFGDGFLAQLDAHIAPYIAGHKVFVITDEHVAKHYLSPLKQAIKTLGREVHSITLPAGERTKAVSVFERSMTEILAHQPDRRSTLIALGGGVVGDLTGFMASVLLRGVPFIQIPTTLLAQVDSSVGGKTAVNCAAGKNLIGSFYQPKAVFMDLATLTTLPKRELLAGYAEVLKYGLLGDASFYERLLEIGEAMLAGDRALQREIVRTCCAMKAAIVAADETEQGKRALLNLGHTFGHALEKQAGYDGSLLHGEAVALGCLMACRLAAQNGNVSEAQYQAVHAHYLAVGLPTHLRDVGGNHHWDAAQLVQHCYGDKKADAGTLTFVTLARIGEAVISRDLAPEAIEAIFVEFGA